MACMIARGDSAEFVPVVDEAAVHEGAKLSPDPDWYLAGGQPPRFPGAGLPDGPDRVRVRSLTAAEVIQVQNAETNVLEAGRLGFVSLNGEAKDYTTFPWQWQITIGRLVWAVTLNPLEARPFAWMASPSPEAASPASSPA